jgi:arsenate reductase
MNTNQNPIKILFLCVANSARSQLAEGIGKSIFGKNAIIQSAGSNPSGFVHPFALKVLKENNIDTSNFYSKSIDELDKNFLENLNYVITLCAEEVCPAFISKTAQKLHWPIQDPAKPPKDLSLEEYLNSKLIEENFRRAYQEIKTKILEFKNRLSIL